MFVVFKFCGPLGYALELQVHHVGDQSLDYAQDHAGIAIWIENGSHIRQTRKGRNVEHTAVVLRPDYSCGIEEADYHKDTPSQAGQANSCARGKQ